MDIEKFLNENKKLLIILLVGLIIIYLIYKKQENIQTQNISGSLTPYKGILYIGTPKYFGRKVLGSTNTRLYVIGGNKALYYLSLDSNGKPTQDDFTPYFGDIFTLGVNTNAVIGVGGTDDINLMNEPPKVWSYMNGSAQNVCVLKNVVWITGTDNRAYHNIGGWNPHGANFLITYIFGDVTKQNPGAIFCIKKDDNQCYYSELNANGTPKVQDKWTPLLLSGKTIQDAYVYNNALWCIASDNNSYYCKLDSNGIPSANSSWVLFDSSVGNLKKIAITSNYVFTYDNANNVYCANNTDSVNGPIKNINFKKWTKIAQSSKPIIQLTTNDNSIWFLFNDGTIAYKLITQLISEQSVIYAEQEAILAEQEATLKANRLKAEQEATIKANRLKAEQKLIMAEQPAPSTAPSTAPPITKVIPLTSETSTSGMSIWYYIGTSIFCFVCCISILIIFLMTRKKKSETNLTSSTTSSTS